MVLKLFLVALILGLTIYGGVSLYEDYKQDEVKEIKYQGPVPLGYDQEHFWKTGEMKKLNG